METKSISILKLMNLLIESTCRLQLLVRDINNSLQGFTCKDEGVDSEQEEFDLAEQMRTALNINNDTEKTLNYLKTYLIG